MASIDNYDAPRWENRWHETCGYLFFRRQFSGGDLINARIRYNQPVDEGLIRQIRRNINLMNQHDFWSGIAAPPYAFYEFNEWTRFGKAGDDLREKALLRFLSTEQDNPALSGHKIALAKEQATIELKWRGYFLETPKRHPPSMERLSIDIDGPPPPLPEDWADFDLSD